MKGDRVFDLGKNPIHEFASRNHGLKGFQMMVSVPEKRNKKDRKHVEVSALTQDVQKNTRSASLQAKHACVTLLLCG